MDATQAGIKPIIGLEAYVAARSMRAPADQQLGRYVDLFGRDNFSIELQ